MSIAGVYLVKNDPHSSGARYLPSLGFRVQGLDIKLRVQGSGIRG